MNYYITTGGSQGRSNTSDVTWILRLGEPLKTDGSDIMGCVRGDVKCHPPLRSDVSSSELPLIWITGRITVNSTRPTQQTVREQPARFRPNRVHVATRQRHFPAPTRRRHAHGPDSSSAPDRDEPSVNSPELDVTECGRPEELGSGSRTGSGPARRTSRDFSPRRSHS